MTPERLQQIERLYHSAQERAPEGRAAFLEEASDGDEELRREVESLLQQSAEGVLNESFWQIPDDSPLNPGAQLGPYQILGPLGAGGMGAVYKALDTRLNRVVAIKVSSVQFSGRFKREARSIASLNHPNICTLYDVGPDYLVMEYVEGQELRGPLDFDDALPIIQQLIDGIEAAHEKNIVHRDLKPANIKITPGGVVKILDFGLAKAMEPTAGQDGNPENSPTFTMGGTQTGTILGTAAYMAPEQAKGKAADRRSDIWSFGVIVYESLTGQRLFPGDTSVEILGAVLNRDPDISAAPARATQLLRWCLEKDRKQRLASISDARRMLGRDSAGPGEFAAPTAPLPSRFLGLPWIVVAVFAVITVVALWAPWRSGKPMDPPTARLTMEIAPAEALTPDGSDRPTRTAIAIAPDGNTVVFSALDPGVSAHSVFSTPNGKFFKLYRRVLDQMESIAIPGTEGAIGPFFSPDGQWIGFWADGKLKKVSLNGGPAFTICDAPSYPRGASWSSTDTIAFAAPDVDLMQVPAKGGTPKVLIRYDPAKGERYLTPHFLPGGKTLLYTVRTGENWADARIVVRLETGEQRVLIQGGTDARYVPTGHLLYMQNAVLMAVPFDAGRMQLTGPPVAMLGGVMQAVNESFLALETGMGQFAVSASGNLIYAVGGIHPPRITTLLWVDRGGHEAELNAAKGEYTGVRVSPDGRKLAVSKQSETSRLSDIWVLDLLAGDGKRLTSQGANLWPLWSPDGKRLLFAGGPGLTQILSVAADGSGAPETFLPAKVAVAPASWSADGKLAYFEAAKVQILTQPMSLDSAHVLFSDSDFIFRDPQFSPDGRWVAYATNETGRPEVWVRAFPGPGEKYSIGPGRNPVWSRSQRELFFLTSTAPGKLGMMAVDIASGAAFKHSQPHQLFEGAYIAAIPLRSYDVTPDGQHFIMLRSVPPPDQRVAKLTVVLNWFDELRRRAPIAK